MSEWHFIGEPWFKWGVLPILIFCARLSDVSLDTMRIIFLNRGRKLIAPLLGFVQVMIWVAAITQVMNNLNNPLCYFAYCGGFAAGNYLGIMIEEKVAAGMLTLRIITPEATEELMAALRKLGHGVTSLVGHGAQGSVNLLYVVLRRKHLPTAVKLVRELTPHAFYSTEEVRVVGGGTLAAHQFNWSSLHPFRRSSEV